MHIKSLNRILILYHYGEKNFIRILNQQRKIIVPSSNTKNIVLVYKDLTIDVIEHGYNQVNKESNYSNIKKTKEKFNIAFIGGISEEKGLRYLKGLILKLENPR